MSRRSRQTDSTLAVGMLVAILLFIGLLLIALWTVALGLVRADRDSTIQAAIERNQLGVNAYIVKPVNFEQFADAIQKIGWFWLLLNQAPKVDGR